MSPCVLLLTVLLFQSAGPTPVPVSSSLGGSVSLPVTIPKGVSVTNLVLRATSREEGVAIWIPGKHLTVLTTHYSNRVTFLEDQPTFRITNVSLDDGGAYEVSMGVSSTETVFGSFMLTVFDITTTVVPLGNDSCRISLLCEAGMGPNSKVTYSWKDTDMGTTLAHDMQLHQIVHPSQKRAYTCTAQIPTAQSDRSIVLEQLCIQSSAGAGRRVLGLVSLLVPTVALLLL